MKKILIFTVIIAVFSTTRLEAFCVEPKIMPYNGGEWHFDVEKRGYPYVTVTPQDRKEPQVYGNGYVDKVQPEQKKYDIIFLSE